MFKKLVAVSIYVALGFCGFINQALAEGKVLQPIKTIAVLPIKDPERFDVYGRAVNKFVPMGWIANKVDTRVKTNLFTEALMPLKIPFGKTLTNQFVDGLNALGYQAYVLDGIKGPADDPDYIDPKRIKDRADALLTVNIEEIGMSVDGKEWHYYPNISLKGLLVSTTQEDYLYEETVYYGVHANEVASWAVAADPSFVYSTADTFMEKPGEVGMRLLDGSKEVAKRMLKNIKKAM
jgi:hypothetical protein